MATTTFFERMLRPLSVLASLGSLAVAQLRFDSRLDPELIRATHAGFARPHPFYQRFGARTAGVAVIDFALVDRMLGYYNRDGTMYLLLTEIVCSLIEEGQVDSPVHGLLLGGRTGLREFKRRAGFAPYRVHYQLG